MGTISKVLDTDINTITTALSGLTKESVISAVVHLKLSEAQAKTIFSAIGLKDAELDAAVAMATAGTSATGAAGGFTAFGAAVKGAAASLWTFLTTNPVGWAIMAAGAIAATAGIIAAFTTSYDEAAKKANESKEAYEQTKSEIESLNSELDSTKSKIDELNAKDGLTLVEAEELSRLEATNEQLERQLAIKEQLAAYQKEQAATDAREAVNNEGFLVYDNGFGREKKWYD